MLKIKTVREEKKMTQNEVVRLSGIKKRSYVDYENGKSDIPFSKLKKIALALNVPVAKLIHDDNSLLPYIKTDDNLVTALKETNDALKVLLESKEEVIALLKEKINTLERSLNGNPNK